MLKFDEATHTYRFDGVRVFSVTQILEQLVDYSGVPQYRLDIAANRGTMVHKATELYDIGVLDEDSVSDEIRGYVEAWKKFLNETQFESELIEQRLFHKKLRYAGTADRIGILSGKRTVIDIKTTASLMPWVGPQTAAYFEAFNHGRPADQKAKTRHAVQLRRDGTYRLEPYRSHQDFPVFTACLSIHNWKGEHNVLN